MKTLCEYETDNGTLIQVFKNDFGYAVKLYDYEAKETVGIKIFQKQDDAESYAEYLYQNQ